MHLRRRWQQAPARLAARCWVLWAALASAAPAAPPDRQLMRAWQEGRQALLATGAAAAQDGWDRLLPTHVGEAYAVVLARPCEGELLIAVGARSELAPLWVTGPHAGCHGLVWGLFATADEARAAAAQVPARYLEGEPEVISVFAPLSALDVLPPQVQADEPLVAARPETMPPPASSTAAREPEPAPARAHDEPPRATVADAPPPAASNSPPLDPSLSAGDLFRLGNEAYARGDYPGAIAAFEASLRQDPINPRTLNNLGTAHLVADQPEEAERSFRSAVKLDPNYARAWLNLGTALYAQGQGLEALPMLEKAVDLDPRNLDAHSNLAALLVELRRWQSARRVLQEALTVFPSEPLLLRQLAQVEDQLAVRGDDDDEEAGSEITPPPAAQSSVRAAAGASPCDGDLSHARRISRAGRYFEEGRSHLGRRQYEAAEWAFQHALECDPTSPAILNHLGAARLGAGRASSAVGAFELALEHDASFLEASVNLALARFQMGRCDDALATLRGLAERERTSGEAAFQLGRMLYRCGRAGEAGPILERAKTLLPADPRPQQLLERLDDERVGAPR